MDIEKLIKLIYENPENISILYTNINGKECLTVTVNGITVEEGNEIFEKIDSFKDNIELLPDYVFDKVLSTLEENIELNKFNNLLDKEELCEDEVKYVESHIKYVNSVIRDIITEEAKSLANLVSKFSR